MLAIAYHYPVTPRHQAAFEHAWRAARDTLRRMPGLASCKLVAPRDRREAFILLLAWNDQTSFERFTRNWTGVWLINGMGLERKAFLAPIGTSIGGQAFVPAAGRRAA